VVINTGTANPQGLYEYGQVLEDAGFYARALEQYSEALKALPKDTENLKRSTLLFGEARLLMTTDPDNEEGINGLKNAIDEGFKDAEALEALLEDERISKDNKEEINRILDKILEEQNAEKETEDEEETEEDEDS
jgi:tetratricopeptide (TPR) repeat protein